MSNRLKKNTRRPEKETNRGLWMNEKYNAWNSKLSGWVNNLLDKVVGRISELEKTFEELIQNEAQKD